MRKYLSLLLIGVVFLIGACGLLGIAAGEGEALYITTSDNLVQGTEYAVIPDEALPDEVKEAYQGKTIVVVPKEAIVDLDLATLIVPEITEDGVQWDWEELTHTAIGVGSIFFPGLAAWEGLIALFSKRKRQWYGKAAKSMAPMSGIPLKELIPSVLKAIGSAHSTPDTKKLAEDKTGNLYVSDMTANMASPARLDD
jgi:hypothetical protein